MATSDVILRTTQTASLKKTFGPIARLVQQGNLCFRPDGLSMTVMNRTQTCMISLHFAASAIRQSGFYSYSSHHECILVGQDFDVLDRALTGLKPSDVTTLRLERGLADRDQLIVQFVNDKRGGEIRVKVLALDEPDASQLAPLSFPHVGIIPSNTLAEIIRTLKTAGGSRLGIRFVPGVEGDRLYLSSRGEHFLTTFECPSWQRSQQEVLDDELGRVEFYNEYDFRFIEAFISLAAVSQTVTLCLRKDYPVVLEFCPEGLGVVRFMVSNSEMESDDLPPPAPLAPAGEEEEEVEEEEVEEGEEGVRGIKRARDP